MPIPLNLNQQLTRQLTFLKNSCDLFDQGYTDEAIRIATSIRVLVHDGNSESLITQLHPSNMRLLSTYSPLPDECLAVLSPLVTLSMTEAGEARVAPTLEGSSTKELMLIQEWWNQIIYRAPNINMSRRDLVLKAANKDGGAHVDSNHPAFYEHVSTAVWTTSSSSDGKENVQIFHYHFLYLRQFGYELLNSPDVNALCG